VYRNDPILEAICEIRFRQPKGIWPLVPGQMYDRLKDAFPEPPAQNAISTFVPPDAPPGVQVVMGQGLPGHVRLWNEDQKTALMIGESLMVISSARPYIKWEKMSALVEKTILAFRDISDDGFDIERIGVRYVNRLDVPLESLEKYFDIAPLRISKEGLGLKTFVARSELKVDGDDDRIVIATFASGMADASFTGFVLDLDVIAQNQTGITEVDQALQLIADLHALEKDIFEASIKDATRTAVFGGFEGDDQAGGR
jgi:uncharacterized protein (TIGR04255 family)